jgi:hypothetical protein
MRPAMSSTGLRPGPWRAARRVAALPATLVLGLAMLLGLAPVEAGVAQESTPVTTPAGAALAWPPAPMAPLVGSAPPWPSRSTMRTRPVGPLASR